MGKVARVLSSHKSTTKVYHFDRYIFESCSSCLYRGLETVASTPRQLAVLEVLLRFRGEAVSKDRLLDEVWKGIFVEEHTLRQTIYLLRNTLGKLPDGREFIESVPKYGYRFSSDVLEVDRSAPDFYRITIADGLKRFLQRIRTALH